ncbi:endothelial zinc finger protein induced by tumor necrosis factor alpha-like [Tigriopus californicus]|uniref:endothelial zinc finger protein induced by tumor necrosis factor alpha-like n=1 Tax=Tigriopus californicus TaxID=6832 RepID=UPI0027D9F783|nr:endothelial zinc finger protein induced by tumor necrosis factor alpha-like [Tigriopus californicus]
MWMKTANDAPSSLNSRQIITPLKFEMGMKDADYSSRTIIKLEGENEPLDLYDILESGSDLNENIVMEENPLGPKCSRTQEQELNGDSMTGRKSYYECSSCHQTFIDFESIRVHKAVYHQDGFAFGSGDPMSFQELQNQEKTLSSIVQTTVHSHNVSQANIESVDVKRHTNRNQATSDQLSCPICALTCATMSTLKVHLLLHEVPHIVCRTCGQKFQTQSKLINHKRTHTREKRFACDLCDYRTGRGDTLTCHKKYVHLGIPRPKKRPRK